MIAFHLIINTTLSLSLSPRPGLIKERVRCSAVVPKLRASSLLHSDQRHCDPERKIGAKCPALAQFASEIHDHSVRIDVASGLILTKTFHH